MGEKILGKVTVFHTEPDTAVNEEGTYHRQTGLLTFWRSGHLASGEIFGMPWQCCVLT